MNPFLQQALPLTTLIVALGPPPSIFQFPEQLGYYCYYSSRSQTLNRPIPRQHYVQWPSWLATCFHQLSNIASFLPKTIIAT